MEVVSLPGQLAACCADRQRLAYLIYYSTTVYQEIMDYFMEASSDNISEAFDEFEGDYAEEDLRLMRLKLHSKHGN